MRPKTLKAREVVGFESNALPWLGGAPVPAPRWFSTLCWRFAMETLALRTGYFQVTRRLG